MKLVYSLALLGCSLFIIELFVYSSNEAKESSRRSHFKESYKIFSLDIPGSLNFCGEVVPVENFDVREKFDRELLVNTYWQSQTILFIKRSNRYFKVIEPILKEEGIPDDFKYLALIESGLTNVISPAGATGFWQIMKSTGREHGLVINNNVDERYHLEKSTRVACKYLKEAYAEFNDWTLAAASYNMGIHGLKKRLAQQKANSYYDLLLNQETARYVYRILAAKEILSNANAYGFHVDEASKYKHIPTHTIEVDSSIADLAAQAKDWGLSYKYLKIFNPWLRGSSLMNSDRVVYQIAIPDEDKFGLIQQLDNDWEKASGSETMRPDTTIQSIQEEQKVEQDSVKLGTDG